MEHVFNFLSICLHGFHRLGMPVCLSVCTVQLGNCLYFASVSSVPVQNVESQNVESDKRSKMTKGKWKNECTFPLVITLFWVRLGNRYVHDVLCFNISSHLTFWHSTFLSFDVLSFDVLYVYRVVCLVAWCVIVSVCLFAQYLQLSAWKVLSNHS